MSDKVASVYHFSTEENPELLFKSCKELLENTELLQTDVVSIKFIFFFEILKKFLLQTFVTKNKVELKAHKLVLSLSSSFFKKLFEDTRLDYKLILPNFSSPVLIAFLQFFYTGQLLIDDVWIEELASLCHEFNCEEIPVLSELIINHRRADCRAEDASFTTCIQEPKVEMDFDESEFFESNDNVETIFFNENEGEFLEATEHDPKIDELKEQPRAIKEEYENVQYIDDDNPNFELVEEIEKKKQELESAESKREDDPQLYENLELAAEDVRKGMSFFHAHKKHNLSRNMILRHLQKTREQRKKTKAAQLKPAFPAFSISQLREEQNKFKKKLQDAINSCRDSGNSIKKASRTFGVPIEAIERNLHRRGFKRTNP